MQTNEGIHCKHTSKKDKSELLSIYSSLVLYDNDFSSARIRIVLDNCGVSYPNYDDQIIVERSITRTASPFVLKTRNRPGDPEKTITRKKSDLDAIMRHFNIDLDNPLAWLSQDRARQFLQQMKPEKLYEVSFYVFLSMAMFKNDDCGLIVI